MGGQFHGGQIKHASWLLVTLVVETRGLQGLDIRNLGLSYSCILALSCRIAFLCVISTKLLLWVCQKFSLPESVPEQLCFFNVRCTILRERIHAREKEWVNFK